MKRVSVLRRTPALKGLVRELRASLDDWRDENKANIEWVGRQRIDTTHFHTIPLHDRPGDTRRQSGGRRRTTGSRYRDTVDKRSNRPEYDDILPEFSQKLKEVVNQDGGYDDGSETDEGSMPPYDLQRDIKARLIQLVRPKPSESDGNSFMANVMEPEWKDIYDKTFKGSFPDQQVSLYHLLNGQFRRVEGKDTAEKACPSNLNYFHIPANNMIWVEQAIASYFGESTEPGGSLNSCPQTKMSTIVTCVQICEKIPVDMEDLYRSGENTQTGLVLFMPYLHWETDRRRNQAANLMEQLEDEYLLDRRETAQMWKSKRQEGRKGLSLATSPSSGYEEPNYYKPRGKHRDQILQTLADLLWKKVRRDADGPMPPGLVHELWQRIRDEEYDNKLLMALKVIVERANAHEILGTLQNLIWENAGSDQAEPREKREWRDILWSIKEVGQGYPTPHTLEDIFWEKIKEEREKADKGKVSKTNQGLKWKLPASQKISQRRTTIFKGVETDGYGRLQPKAKLAQVLVKAAKLYEQIITFPDQQIMEKYLFKNASLHPRRTLDQAYFWRLRTTRLRDRDQVVYRYTNAEFAHRYQVPSDNHRKRKSASSNENASRFRCLHTKQPEPEESMEWTRHGSYEQQNGCDQCTRDICKVSRAIMVDQLWMWVLDKDTILTCFPQRYGASDKGPSGVHQSIRMRVKTRTNPDNHIRSIFDLALIILNECFDTFLNRTRTEGQRPQVMDMFAESIGLVKNKQSIAFKHLWTLSKRLTEIYQSGVEDKVDPSILLALLNVTPEAELQRENRDIIDELDIVVHIVNQQKEMVTRFVKSAKELLKPPTLDACSPRRSGFFLSVSEEKEERDNTIHIMQQQYDAFKDHSDDFLSEIDDRINELSSLKLSAESTAQNVTELLSLKQQQASVVQAYEAMKQREETVRQGKAIMVFTVMTIVFLPLSFMSSIFGMNAVELTGSDPPPDASDSSGPVPDEIVPFWPVTFKRQILIMFTVSFGVVLAVLIPAFSPFIRASISSVLQWSIAKTITWTGMYRLWLETEWSSKDQRDGARKEVQKMKNDVRKRMQGQILRQSEIRDGVRPRKEKPSSSPSSQPSPLSSSASARNRSTGAGGSARNVIDGDGQGSTSARDVEKGIVE
ncbi:hypothetical protein VM1G_02760 [Cytospora mali]|uniref:Uncharacterized protein n=1 Tax=Cytospora mali TaxID=578113 RepID=A0A194VUR9_CYTMA|nr:hypothetical protein VM1G_02760 [Valsa mali]